LNERSDDILALSKRIDEQTEAINGLSVQVDVLRQLCQQIADHLFYEGQIQAGSLHMPPMESATALPSDLPSNQRRVKPSTTMQATETPDKQPPQSVATASCWPQGHTGIFLGDPRSKGGPNKRHGKKMADARWGGRQELYAEVVEIAQTKWSKGCKFDHVEMTDYVLGRHPDSPPNFAVKYGTLSRTRTLDKIKTLARELNKPVRGS
jgi:hypothetical protein